MERLQRAADTLSMENRRLRKVSGKEACCPHPKDEDDGAVIVALSSGLGLATNGLWKVQMSPVFLIP